MGNIILIFKRTKIIFKHVILEKKEEKMFILDVLYNISNYYFSKQKIKKRIKNKEKNVLYAFQCQNCKNCVGKVHKERFKVGKTINLKQRIRSYNTLYPDGKVFHTVECLDIDRAERILFELLKINNHHFKQEIFDIDGKLLTEYMELAKNLNSFTTKCNKEKLKKLNNYLGKF